MRPSSRPPRLRLLAVAAVFLASLYLVAPSLGLAGLFRPFMSAAAHAAYRTRALPLGLDLAGGHERIYRVGSRDPAVVAAAAGVLRHRLDLLGTSNGTVSTLGADRLLVELPGLDPAREARLAAVLDATDLLGLHRVLGAGPSALAREPGPGARMLPPADPRAGEWLEVEAEPRLGGDALAGAEIAFDPLTGEPRIRLRFHAAGAAGFARVTRELVGERLAIVLADRVYMAPVVEGEIPDGEAVIRGRFDLDEARTVVSILRAGSLPAPLTREATRAVGPGLGAASIRHGVLAIGVGTALVAAYLVRLYGRVGVAACLGQVQNVLLVLSGMVLLDAALTLPGLAGIALGLGMSLDANVLVNERIREELGAGRPARRALELGFERAHAAVLDGNLTTLLTAAALYGCGTGPVKGFALTLALGLAASMYSALFVVRTLLEARPGAVEDPGATLGLTPDPGPPAGLAARLAAWRRPALAASALAVALAGVGLATRGLAWGVEFTGGSMIRFRRGAADGPGLDEVRAALAEPARARILGPALVREADGGREVSVLLRTPGPAAAVDAALASALGGPGGLEAQAREEVGPRMGDEVRTRALGAVGLGALGVLAYMAVRFEPAWGLAAVAALAHDAVLVLGVFAWSGREVGGDVLAALLTVIGYSVNDTIVVLDRLRDDPAGGFDLALARTLRRTMVTAGLVSLPILAILGVGGPALADLGLAMAVGMAAGTWSTVFVVGAALGQGPGSRT